MTRDHGEKDRVELLLDQRARRAALLRREVLDQVADSVVGDPAEPAGKRPRPAPLEAREGAVRLDVGLLEHVQRIEARAQARAHPAADIDQQPVSDAIEEVVVGPVTAGPRAVDQLLGRRAHAASLPSKPLEAKRLQLLPGIRAGSARPRLSP